MAKKKSKKKKGKVQLKATRPSGKKESRGSESEPFGWIAYGIAYAVCAVGIYYFLRNKFEPDSELIFRFGVVLVLGAIGAGLITWILNSVYARVRSVMKRRGWWPVSSR